MKQELALEKARVRTFPPGLPRGMAECGQLTVKNRVAVQRAYGLGGTRDASGAGKASEKKVPVLFGGCKKLF